ncbi:MAG TPA: pirin family protein [Alphaproteobacteria bacterium]|nr:pirin family protein [Alphaproteobacteria bacterium]
MTKTTTTTAQTSATADADGAARAVTALVRGQPANDGAGVRLTRIIGSARLLGLDPFLLLDEFRSDNAADYIAGFPEHPHRGFETVTYMLAGRMRHGDNKGNTGLLRPGSVQWMTAGRGILHSEMPEQENGLLWGFQLWVNLPAKDKMTAPRYQDIAPEAIPEVTLDTGVRVRVIAGRLGDAEGRAVEGPVRAVATEPVYLDISLPAGAGFAQALPRDHAAFAYVFEGSARIGAGEAAKPVARGELAVLGPGDRVEVAAEGEAARLLVIAGRPLREPVARYGPFVMNRPEEIREAIADFSAGRF